MRDLFVTMVVFGVLPFIFKRPYIGVLLSAWLGYMNPHKLAWGFSTQMPFVFIVTIVTIIAIFISSEKSKMVWSRETILLFIFVVWMAITTINSLYPYAAWVQWDKVWRIQILTVIAILLMNTKYRINLFMWVIALSIGFYGVKGGIWVLSTGGAHRVQGPYGTFIGGNNELGLAMIMIIPMLRYLQLTASRILVRNLLTVAITLVFIAIIGTHSRGALVGLVAMTVFYILKTRKKFIPLLMIVLIGFSLPSIMPQHWFDRMDTIETHEDGSSQERLRAWRGAYDLASERVTGGGFDALIYWTGRDAHSIYFEVLGEHGFIGLFLFLLIIFLTWRSGSWVIKHTKKKPDLQWASDLSSMMQVSIIGYCSAGAFLGLAYFDLIYHLIVIIVLTRVIVEKELAKKEEEVRAIKAEAYS